MTDPVALRNLLGHIDIYVLDQLLRGNIEPGMRILDVGCGGGRNLGYFLRAGFDVMGLDHNPRAIAAVRSLARELSPRLSPEEAFRVESVEDSSFADGVADVVFVNAVFHFARDHAHFEAELEGSWRLLAPGGLFLARLASSIGVEDRLTPRGGGRFAQPDTSELYLVDLEQLLNATARLGGRLLDPIKTTNVQGMRSMTTWVLRKRGS